MTLKRSKATKYQGLTPANNMREIENPSLAKFLVIGIKSLLVNRKPLKIVNQIYIALPIEVRT